MATNTRRRTAAWVLTAGLAGLLLPIGEIRAQDVSVDYDKEADFTKRRTYAWKPGAEAPDPLTEQKIQQAVEAQLAAKGLTEVEASPDLWVVTHTSVTTDARVNVETFGYGGGYGWNGWYAWGPATTVRLQEVLTGMLLVDLLDGPDEKLIWRGVATATVYDRPDPDKTEKRVRKATLQMFKKFPPPPKK